VNSKRIPLIWVALLLLTSGLVAFSLVPSVHTDPTLDNGCYCHNNGIGVWFNGTGFNEFGGVFVSPGATFVLNATSKNIAAAGVVPGLQQWMPTMGDNAKFVFEPQSVNDTSPLNLLHQKGNITAMYTVTVPSSPGLYSLQLYAQGTIVGFPVQVTGPTSTTTSSSTSTTSSSSTSTTSSTTPPSTTTTTTLPPATVTTQATTTVTVTATATSTNTSGLSPELTYGAVIVVVAALVAVGLLTLRRRAGT